MRLLTTPFKAEDYQADNGMDDSLLFFVISVKCLGISSLVALSAVVYPFVSCRLSSPVDRIQRKSRRSLRQ
jgi:hypothetical protein